MGYNPFSPICLAQLNLLCVPAARISKHHFEEFVNALKSCSPVRLNSAPGHKPFDEVTPAEPQTRPGTVLLDVSDRHFPDQAPDASLYDTNRNPQIVLGLIASEDVQHQAPSKYADEVQALVIKFREYSRSLQHAVLAVVCVLGGPNLGNIEDCLWIDTVGSGPSLPDVVAQLINDFHRALPAAVAKFRSKIAGTPDPLVSSDRNSAIINGQSSEGNPASQNELQANRNLPAQSVVSGLINLQAGRWDNAFLLFSDAATGARGNGDHVWYAKALEGLLSCMLLFAWAHYDFEIPQICYPSNEKHGNQNHSPSLAALLGRNRPPSTSIFSNISTKPIHALTELLSHIISSIVGLYERAADVAEGDERFVMLNEARIRWVDLLTSIKNNGSSLQDGALESMINNSNTGNLDRSFDTTLPSLKLSSHLLSDVLMYASLEAQMKLPVQRAVTVQLAIARSLSVLRLERKQGLCLKQFLQLLVPALLEARRVGAAEVGVHPAASLPQLDDARSIGRFATAGGARDLLRSIAELYGVPVASSKQHEELKSPADKLNKALVFWCGSRGDGDLFMKLETLSLCVEVADAIPDPESSLVFTSYLFQASRATVTVSANSVSAEQSIVPGELKRLQQNMARAIGAAERFGLPGLRADYWDKFLVRDVWYLEEFDRLVPRTARDLSIAAIGQDDAKRDPFIFNPFAKAKPISNEAVVAVGDLAQFTVVLQNPLDIDVDIEDIFLTTEGCKFTPTHHNIVLGPLCSQAFTLTGRPDELGSLRVVGCTARIRSCREETFLVLPDHWKPAPTIKLHTRSGAQAVAPQITPPKFKELLLKVIEPLPRLSIKSTSLTQASLMMLEGETTELTITCHNTSSIDIDFVLLTFEDSVTRRLEEALSNKALSPADVYEIQYQIATRPAVRWKKGQGQVRIPAQKTSIFTLEVSGQPGLSEVQVLINYAYLNRPKADITGIFYTRQLTYSLITTVNGGVDISRCAVLSSTLPQPQHLTSAHENSMNLKRASDHSENMPEADNQCILSLDIRNVWPYPLEVDVEACTRNKDMLDEVENAIDHRISQVRDVVQPGQLTRVLLRIPRIHIKDPQAAVPNLDTNRQFVVSASRMTVEAEAAGREAFWYRERLLECLSGSWKELNGNRHGRLDMRKAIRLAPRMIEALRLEHVEVSMLLRDEQPAAESGNETILIKQTATSVYEIPRNRFARLVTVIKNQSDQDLRLLLRLQPSLRQQPHGIALDISKHFGWSGVLQRVVHPPLKPGESRFLELGIVVLAIGEYEINATVEEVQTTSSREKSDFPGFGTSNERRLWHARSPCLIDVCD